MSTDKFINDSVITGASTLQTVGGNCPQLPAPGDTNGAEDWDVACGAEDWSSSS